MVVAETRVPKTLLILENNNDLVLKIKSIIPYLNGNYNDFGPKRMQDDRYLILLYGATMIDEFKQRGTKHGKLLYFSYNQLKYISKNPLLDGPLNFESTRTARRKVYPILMAKKLVRIEKIDVESYDGAECVAITKRGIDTARLRLDEIGNGLSMDANAWLYRGLALAKLGKYIESIHCYDIALQIDPNLAWAWNNKGNSLISLGNYDKGIQCVDTALKIDPNLARAWDNKAWVLGHLEKYGESIQCIDIALKIDPNFDRPWYRKGWTLEKLGKSDEAKQYFEKARQLGFEG